MSHTITVIGLGFVGLTTALVFADKGHQVYGYDIDGHKSSKLSSGILPFHEPALAEILHQHIGRNFNVCNDIQKCVRESDFLFLCVGTPAKDDGTASLEFVYSAIDSFASVLNDGKYRVIVIKSTVPPSTTEEKIKPYFSSKGVSIGVHCDIANNPEFLREGTSWNDASCPDRIVCGVENDRCANALRLLYLDFKTRFFAVSLNTSEFLKYLSNSMLATFISFSNEMAQIADAIGGIDVKAAFQMLHLDRRWTKGEMHTYVYPGAGYGGYCLPKDTRALEAEARSRGVVPSILQSAIGVNDRMPIAMANRVKKAVPVHSNIGILGLSFKPGSDDVRDSPAAKIILELRKTGYANIFAFDPVANDQFSRVYSELGLSFCNNIDELAQAVDVFVLVTAWSNFLGVDKRYPEKNVIDCRYVL